jgi:aspartyl-tRNA synthetase
MLRTNTCGELNKDNVKKNVTLCGWVDSRRDHGGIIFVDLRDRYGLTQIVFEPTHSKNVHETAEKLRREFVIQAKGHVRMRGEGLTNPKLATGEIEILVEEVTILSESETPPIDIDDRKVANEDMRLKYRYLDLRRPSMQKALEFRHKVVTSARNYFNSHKFLEIETPLLIKSTPEGARDYVVPSRVNPGHFYALPQSPQLYKQILMIAGFDRYYQVARCLRDEDLRADRQPEHTQFDLEMSFAEQEDIRQFVEGLYKHIFKETLGVTLDDFPAFSYNDSMERFGSDKPDIRFSLELKDVTDIVKKSDFGVFKTVAETGGKIRCLNPSSDLPRKEIDRYIEFCQSIGSKGMAWMRVGENALESNIAKFFSSDVQKELIQFIGAKPGSILMFIADKPKKSAQLAGQLRLKLAEDLKLIPKEEFKFCWINDFPLFAFNEETNAWEPEHHMFSMPKKEFCADFEKRPGEVLGDLWDLVLNGVELGSGSIRVTDPKLQERIMAFIGIDNKSAEEKFGFLLNAYKYGGPVHGGMGLGVDRTVALMMGTNDIREVIAFPKNKSAQCPMDESPGLIEEKQMKELHLKTDVIKK